MFTAAELINAVQRKLRLTSQWRLHTPGEFPPGWAAWFSQMRVRADAITGATAEAMMAVLLARPISQALPAAVGDLTRWQAFASVWRQQWQPPEADERGLRWFAGASSAIIHVLLGALLLWLLFAPPRFSHAPSEGEETVVQVEYIGEGTTEDVGGGPQVEPVAESETAETAEAAVPSVEPVREVAATPPAPAPVQPVEPGPSAPEIEPVEPIRAEAVVEVPPAPAVAPPEITVPEPPAAEVEQRLTVSEPAPDSTDVFFLPPPVPVVREPELAIPELEASRTAVLMRDVPEPEQAPSLPTLDIRTDTASAVPEVTARQPEVVLREVPAPVRRPELPALETPSARTPELESRTVQVRERSIPAPETGTAAATSSEPESPAAGEAAATPQEPGTQSASAQPASPASATQETAPGMAGAPAAATETGARPDSGPRSEPAPGGWPTPSRGDDWGASDREVPGGQRGDEGPGIFNSDGSVRLADTPGSASPAQPPGAHTEEITDLDRTGTWLKRPPIGYEPTMFDRYWRPNETLLQEWVRRGIKAVEIPIPGTTKKISCAVSLLALGGGCGISDPNLNEQPAGARPPPDIPFKPDLQDDNGSVRPDEQPEVGG